MKHELVKLWEGYKKAKQFSALTDYNTFISFMDWLSKGEEKTKSDKWGLNNMPEFTKGAYDLASSDKKENPFKDILEENCPKKHCIGIGIHICNKEDWEERFDENFTNYGILSDSDGVDGRQEIKSFIREELNKLKND